MRENLLDLLAYDRWANDAWIPVLDALEPAGRGREVMRHILRAQHSWLSRCLSEDEAGPSVGEDLAYDLNRLHTGWEDLITHGDPGAFASYTREGVPQFHTVEQICRHVVNHGTYHRGELRGLAAAMGSDDFPETDLIRYFRERG